MTIRLIGEDPGAAKTITHRECGAVVEYHQNDVRILYQGTDISGGPDGREGFNCPKCGKEITTRAW